MAAEFGLDNSSKEGKAKEKEERKPVIKPDKATYDQLASQLESVTNLMARMEKRMLVRESELKEQEEAMNKQLESLSLHSAPLKA